MERPRRRPRPEARPELARGEEDGVLSQVKSLSFGPWRGPSLSPTSLAYGSCFLPACASICSRSTISGWCSSNAGRSERIRGISRKLCRGGGDEVAHSSELPWPQGSSASASRPYRHDFTTL